MGGRGGRPGFSTAAANDILLDLVRAELAGRPGLRVLDLGCGAALTFSRATLSRDDQPVPGEPFVFTLFAGEPLCFLTEAELVEELFRAGFEKDLSGPLIEYNRPVPGRTLTRGGPAIYEGTFRAVRSS